VQYALVLAQLAAAAHRFLLHLQQLANTQAHPDPSSPTLVSPCHTSTPLVPCRPVVCCRFRNLQMHCVGSRPPVLCIVLQF